MMCCFLGKYLCSDGCYRLKDPTFPNFDVNLDFDSLYLSFGISLGNIRFSTYIKLPEKPTFETKYLRMDQVKYAKDSL